VGVSLVLVTRMNLREAAIMGVLFGLATVYWIAVKGRLTA
jgi:hypothetical protein